MRLTLLAIGSRGDTEPYVALGAALRAAGAEVRLAAFEAFRELATEAGLGFYPVAGDVRAVAESEAMQRAAQADTGSAQVVMTYAS